MEETKYLHMILKHSIVQDIVFHRYFSDFMINWAVCTI